MELEPSDLQEILRVFADSEMRDLRIEVGDTKLHVSKDSVAPAAPAAAAAPGTTSAASQRAAAAAAASVAPESAVPGPPAQLASDGGIDRTGLIAVRSPGVGIFYRRPAPGQPPYVELGSRVSPETPVCTIEVMKMFTEVRADCTGTVVEICAENGELVEHGQVLMYVDPLPPA